MAPRGLTIQEAALWAMQRLGKPCRVREVRQCWVQYGGEPHTTLAMRQALMRLHALGTLNRPEPGLYVIRASHVAT